MNERVALLTGAVLGTLQQVIAEADSVFTYRSATPVLDHDGFTNVIIVEADDGVRFTVTVEQEP